MTRRALIAVVLVTALVVGCAACSTESDTNARPGRAALADKACDRLSAAFKLKFTSRDLEALSVDATLLRRSRVTGSRKIADGIDGATSDEQRGTAIADAFLWCSDRAQNKDTGGAP